MSTVLQMDPVTVLCITFLISFYAGWFVCSSTQEEDLD